MTNTSELKSFIEQRRAEIASVLRQPEAYQSERRKSIVDQARSQLQYSENTNDHTIWHQIAKYFYEE
jgi:hypothetical protein